MTNSRQFTGLDSLLGRDEKGESLYSTFISAATEFTTSLSIVEGEFKIIPGADLEATVGKEKVHALTDAAKEANVYLTDKGLDPSFPETYPDLGEVAIYSCMYVFENRRH